jgi:hypothetical protein
MANCIYCGTETSLFQRELPRCAKCAEAMGAGAPAWLPKDRVRRLLMQEVAGAAARAEAASAGFKVLLSSLPTGIPHPDGAQRIHQAAHDLSNARKDLMQAHARLDDFLRSGVIPENLKDPGNGE